MACISDGVTVQSPAFPPDKIIDSLGAGDTFNAGVIHYLNKVKISTKNKDKGSSNNPVEKSQLKKYDTENLKFSQTEFIDQNILQAAITFACRVAGTKVGMKGYDGLDKIFTKFE